MALTDPDHAGAAGAMLVAEPEAVAAAPLAFPSREASAATLPLAGLGVLPGAERSTKIDRGLLEHLRGDLVPPRQARGLLGDGAVRSGDEDTPGGLAALPGVAGVDQVKPRPGDLDLWVCPLGGKGIGDQPKALVVGEPGRPGVSGEHRRLRGGGSKREPERGVPHGSQDRTRRMRHP